MNTANRNLEARFAPDMKRILFGQLGKIVTITTGSIEDDWGGIDMRLPERTFGCRVRNHFAMSFGDFTLRSRSLYGARTETHRLADGEHPDVFLYAWLTQDGLNIERWLLVDMHALYRHLDTFDPPMEMTNPDGSRFHAYNVRKLAAVDAVLCSNYGAEIVQQTLTL